ncbi:hypothetical protein D3C81_2176620 [compost metagenome]
MHLILHRFNRQITADIKIGGISRDISAFHCHITTGIYIEYSGLDIAVGISFTAAFAMFLITVIA